MDHPYGKIGGWHERGLRDVLWRGGKAYDALLMVISAIE